MASTEKLIAAVLASFISELVGKVLAALGLLAAARTPAGPIQVTLAWQVEIWVEVTIPGLVKKTGLSLEAETTLRSALGQLVNDLDQVVAAGGTAADVRRTAVAFRDRWTGWARRVATTESTRIAAEAVLSSPAARVPGAKIEWLTSHDAKVRATHRAVDGDRVPVGGSFAVGGFPMRYPCDPLGPPEEIVNCRCGIKIVGPGGRT